MSDNEQPQEPNPYTNRDHEIAKPIDKSDVMAVAGLLGQVTGALSEIDRNNVGGDGHNVRAKQIDPKKALTQFAGAGYSQPPAPRPQVNSVPPPVQAQQIPPPVQNSSEDIHALEKRISDLERIVQTYKNVVKFKRGVSYTLSTSKITGEFKDVSTILDIVSAELAKQTKSITIKLNDNTKNK
tara:strand:- start:1579 stop:2127 length:549 start_codon:yes stop_codon:yes gene_type:complete